MKSSLSSPAWLTVSAVVLVPWRSSKSFAGRLPPREADGQPDLLSDVVSYESPPSRRPLVTAGEIDGGGPVVVASPATQYTPRPAAEARRSSRTIVRWRDSR